MNEEIVFGMGLDTTPFAAGLRSAKRLASDAAGEIKSTFINGLKEAFAPLLGAFAVTGLAESIKGAAEFGKQIKINAEEAGVSTDFIQGLASASHKLGIDAETSAASISILSRKIGEARAEGGAAAQIFERWGVSIDGLSNEQVFYQIADKMKEITDPAQRSAMAFDLMGRGAKEMAAALPIGADAMKSLVESASKLSEDEIVNLDAMDAKLEELGRKWHILWGSIVAGIFEDPPSKFGEDKIKAIEDKLWDAKNSADERVDPSQFREEAIAQLTKEAAKQGEAETSEKSQIDLIKKANQIREDHALKSLSSGDKLNALSKKKESIENDIASKVSDGLDIGQQMVELAKTENDLIDARKQLIKEANDQDKAAHEELQKRVTEMKNLQREYDNDEMRLQDAKDQKQEAWDKKTKLSLADLANSKIHFSGTLGEDQQKARHIAELDRQRQWNVQHGFYDLAGDRQSEIDRIKGTLSNNVPLADRESEKKANENIGRMQSDINALLKHAETKGIPITVNTIAP